MPAEILYDRMKTVWIDTDGGGETSGTRCFEPITQTPAPSRAVGVSGSQSTGNSGRAQMQYIRNGVENNYLVDSQGNITISVPFTFGTPFTYTISFYALAQLYRYQEGSSASADFFSTVILDGIDVKDQDNNPLTDFSIASQSGTTYNSSGVVPEPSTYLLMAFALSSLIVRRAHAEGLRRSRSGQIATTERI